jgi:hypothetical protein
VSLVSCRDTAWRSIEQIATNQVKVPQIEVVMVSQGKFVIQWDEDA